MSNFRTPVVSPPARRSSTALDVADYWHRGTPAFAFNACLADCIARRLPMEIPGGTFTLAAPLIIPSSEGVRIIGAGRGATVLRAEANLNDFVVRFDSTLGEIRHAEISHLSIDGNQGLQSSGGCLWARGAVQCTFAELHTKYPHTDGILLDGIQAGGFGHHNRIVNCLGDGGSTSPGTGIGLRIFASDENDIVTCDFEDNGGVGAEVGAIIDQAGLNTYTGVKVVNGKDGLRVKDTGRVRLIGCTFDGPSGPAVIISGDLCYLSGNTFLEGKAGQSYIHMNNGGGNTVLANTFVTSGAIMRSLVRESGGATNNTVHLNRHRYSPATPSNTPYEQEFPGTGTWTLNTAG